MVAPDRPLVTLVGCTSPPGRADVLIGGDDERPARSVWPLLLLAALAVAAVAVVGDVRPDDQPGDRRGEVDAALTVDPDGLSVTATGVIIVAVQLRNLGGPLEVRKAQAYAEPVRLDPAVQAPAALEALQARRLVVLLAPDCRLLRAESGLRFTASILVRVGAGSVGRDVVLDVGSDPAVQDRVGGLCGRPGGPPGVPFD